MKNPFHEGYRYFLKLHNQKYLKGKKKQSMNLLIQLKKYIILTSAVEGGMPAY